jgi:hypothetical protein
MSRLALEVERICKEIRTRKEQPAVLTRQREKAVKRKSAAAVISEVRAAVWVLDAACICGRCKPSKFDEMHELDARSKTRGRPPEDRFNVRNCVRLSRHCHAMVTGEVGHGKRLQLEVLDQTRGAMGPIRGVFKNGTVFTYQRKG